MRHTEKTARRDAQERGGARCVAIVYAANAGLAIGGVALIAWTGAGYAPFQMAALAAVAGALVAARIGKAVRNG